MKNTELKALEVKVSEILGKEVQIVRNVTPLKQKLTVDEMLLEMENKQRMMAARKSPRELRREQSARTLSDLLSKTIRKVDEAVKKVDDYFFFNEEKFDQEMAERYGHDYVPQETRSTPSLPVDSSKIVYVDFSKQ